MLIGKSRLNPVTQKKMKVRFLIRNGLTAKLSRKFQNNKTFYQRLQQRINITFYKQPANSSSRQQLHIPNKQRVALKILFL